MKIKVLIVDDHDLVREGLRSILENNSEIEIIAEAENGEVALKKAGVLKPDLVLMDLSMPVMNGLECTKHIKSKHPEQKVLVLSMYDDEDYLSEAMEAGADGYILKTTKPEEFVSVIKKIVGGDKHIGNGFKLKTLLNYKQNPAPLGQSSPKNLDISQREMDVLILIAEGLTNTEIANKLFTSVRTIETRRKKLLEKTNTTNTATLIKFAVKQNLVP
jgi:DNA-binding NarL/FixJ family response regulator